MCCSPYRRGVRLLHRFRFMPAAALALVLAGCTPSAGPAPSDTAPPQPLAKQVAAPAPVAARRRSPGHGATLP